MIKSSRQCHRTAQMKSSRNNEGGEDIIFAQVDGVFCRYLTLRNRTEGVAKMLKLLTYRLRLVPSEERVLEESLHRYNKACAYVADYADSHRIYGVEKLRTHQTRRVLLNKSVQTRFGIQSGLAESAIRRVVADYTRQNPDVHGDSRRPNIPTYEENTWMLCTPSTASIVMKALPPSHMAKYPFRVSVSTYKSRGGRLKVPFKEPLPPAPKPDENDTWGKKEMRLGVDSSNGENWSLVVAVEVPEEDVVLGLDGSDPREQPDYQESDYTPLDEIGE
jgi:hypothetical protein